MYALFNLISGNNKKNNFWYYSSAFGNFSFFLGEHLF